MCDTDVDEASITDEEIDALIGIIGSNPYCVAAEILSKLLAKFTARGLKSGVVEKQVSKLRLRYGSDVSTAELLTDRVNHLRRECIGASLPAFTVLGPRGCRKHRRRTLVG